MSPIPISERREGINEGEALTAKSEAYVYVELFVA